MKLPRFTVRRLMVHVAILALAMAFLDNVAMPWAARRSEEFRELGQYHRGVSWTIHPVDRNRRRAGWNSARLLEYHARMAEKYDRAARFPWLPVAPDPPEPE